MATNLDPNDPAIINLMAGCPNAWQGDAGFIGWCQSLYDKGFNDGVASVPPPTEPPTEPPPEEQPAA